MANNNFSNFFSAPTENADEKDELQEILGDRDKINAVLSSPAAQKIMEKLNGKKNGHQ